MKFISSLELIESPVEKLALKGLPNEIAALRSNLRTSVISVNKNIMNDIRDAEGEVQLNGQIKHPPEMSSQVKNVLTLSSCDLTVKKVIIPAEWEKKLAESSSIDSNGLSESSRMSPGFATHKVNKVHLESKEKSDPPKEDSSVEMESLKSKSAHPTVLENTTSIPERSATETSNVTNGIDEWSNEASKSAGEESLSISNSPHTVATNVTNECSAKMPLQAESCSPKNAEYDVEVDESSTFLGIRVKDVKKCDSEKNELNDETERTGKLNSAFETDQSDTTFKDKINNIRHLDDKVSELDMPERSQENMIANKSNVTTDIQVNPAVESKKQSENSPKSDDPNTEEDNEQFEEKTEIFNFYDKLTANAMHDKTNGIQAGNDFSSISSDDGNSKLADIVEDLENMGSLHAPNAEFDNSCNAVDQPNNFGSKYQLEEPDDDMSGLNDFVKARTDNVSEIDTQDNDKDLETVEGNDNIDAAMDVDDDEIENGNVELEIDKTDEHVDAKTDEHINAKIHELMDTEESMDAEEVVNEITELPDNEEGLDKTDEHEETKRDIDKSCELSNESAVGETSEPVSTDEMLGKIGNQEESKSVVDETCERKIEVPPDTSSESANAEESLSAIGKPEESEKIVDESHELLNEAPLGMVAESGKCEVNANETNELFNVAPGGETNKSSKAEEMLVKDRELSKQVGLIKSDGCADAETTLNKDSELHDEAALDKTNELDETKAISDRTSELGDKTTELTSALSSKTDEPDNDEEISDNSISIVDETMVDKTDKLDNVEAILDAPDKFIDEVASDKTDEPDDAEATSNETDDPDDAAEATLDKPDAFKDETTLNKTDEPDDAEAMLDKPNDAEATLDKPDDAEATLDKPDDAEATLDKPDDAEATLDKPDDAEATLDKPDDAEATLDKPDDAEAMLDKPDAEAMLDKHDEPDDTEATLDKPDEPDDAEATLDKSDEPDDAEATLDKPEEPDDAEAMLDKSDEFMDEAALNKIDEPDDAEAILDKPDESALNKTDEFDDAKATLDKSDENLDKVALGKLDESMDTKEALEESPEVESMDTEEASEESPKVESMDTEEALKESPKVEVDREVEKTAEGASKEGNVSESKITPKENKESLECVLKDEAVSEESVDTKKKIVDVDSKTLPDSAGSEKCLETKPEKDAIVAVDKPAAKRLASEDVATEVKRTKIDTVEGTLVTEDSSNSAAEGKEVNEEVFRTASKRLSEPVEVGEAKKPRLELGSEISDSGAADVGTVQDSDHSSQSEDKNKVEPESKSKEAVSVSDKVTDSTKKEEESSHVDSKASSEAAPTEKDASESKEEESSKPAEAATSNTEAESPKPAGPKQMSNLDLAIERVVAAAAAAAEAQEAGETTATAIDIDDDDDEEVVATEPSKPSEPKRLYSLPFMDKLHSNIIKKMGRNELEEFVMQKVCEVLTERCQLGRLRQQVQGLEEQNESWRKKTQMLQKQLKDLDLVMKRFVNDSRMKRDRPFPVKVTRSVGLQVHMPNNGPQQPGKQRSPGEPNRNQPTHRRRNRTSLNTSQPTQNGQQSQPATTTIATSSSPLSTTTVQQSQPQPQPQAAQSQVSTIQQQQPILAQMVTTPPAQPVKTMQQSARSPICSTVTVQKVVAPNLAKMGTTATIVHPRTSTSNLSNTAVKLPTSTKPVPIRPAITAMSTQNTITTVNSTAGSLSTGLRVASASQLNSRTIRPGVTATLCPVSKPVPGPDSKVIDLTDEDDKSKLNIVRFTTSSTATPVNSTVVTTATTSVHSGAIRVVHPHQLTGNTTATILTAGNQQPQSRFAYLMPSSGSPGQQRQVLIATSAAQVRPGMVTVSSRPTMSPTTFLLKNGSMLPIQQPTQAQTVTNATAILRPAASIQQPVRAGQPVRVSPSLVGRIPTANMPTLAPAINRQHPAPLPVQPMSQPSNPLWKCAPPKPELKTSRVNNNKQQGIVLSWNMQLTPEYEEIASYQLFAYQEGPAPPNTSLWKKVGDVKALPLPMACTLTQFMEGHKYHFAVRAVDVHSRVGPFSAPRNIVLTRK